MRAIRASSSPVYDTADTGTGRCRIPKGSLMLSCRLGCIARLKLSLLDRTRTVLCTVWPDYSNLLDTETLCVDDTVFEFANEDEIGYIVWSECSCEIVDITPPDLARSVRISYTHATGIANGHSVKSASLLGLPVSTKCYVQLRKTLFGNHSESQWINVRHVDGTSKNRTAQLVGTGTLLKREPLNSDRTNDSRDGSKATLEQLPRLASTVATSGSTAVVQDLIQRVVLPRVAAHRLNATQLANCRTSPAGASIDSIGACSSDRLIHNQLHLHKAISPSGVLLVGPPGVGKTYAVKGVRDLCQSYCKVHILELHIPTLLSESNPLSELQKVFSSLAALNAVTNTNHTAFTGTAADSTTLGSSADSPISSHSKQRALASPSFQSTPTATTTATSTASSPEPPSTPPVADTGSASGKKSGFSFRASMLSTPTYSSSEKKKRHSFLGVGSTSSQRAGMNSSSRSTPNASEGTGTGTGGASSAAAAAAAEATTTTTATSFLPEVAFVVIDEIDALGKPGMQNESQIVIKQYICNWLDEQTQRRFFPTAPGGGGGGGEVLVDSGCNERIEENGGNELGYHCPACMIATSNRAADIDPAFCRGGRLEYEIAVMNTQEDRKQLLVTLLHCMDVSFSAMFQATSTAHTAVLIPPSVPSEPFPTVSVSVSSESSLSPVAMTAMVIERLSERMAVMTGGYVAADLVALVRTMQEIVTRDNNSAATNPTAACTRIDREDFSTVSPPDIDTPLPPPPTKTTAAAAATTTTAAATTIDSLIQYFEQIFHEAARKVTPSCLRGVAVQLPNLSYDDVIGYEDVKIKLQRVMAFAHPDQQQKLARFGLLGGSNGGGLGGVLLYGPPGNSKTRLITAAAASHRLPMITLSAADVYSAYVGDAEAEIRRAFQIARQAAPSVLFIDELDSIVTNRDNHSSSSSGGGSTSASVEGRVLATLLTEMDGINHSNNGGGSNSHHSNGGVIVLGATNRLDFIDAALLRKGRFHQVLYVPPPSETEQMELLTYFATKCRLIPPSSSSALAEEEEEEEEEEEAVGDTVGDTAVSNATVISNGGDGVPMTSSSGSLQEVNVILGELKKQLKSGMSGAEIENICREAAMRKHRPPQFTD